MDNRELIAISTDLGMIAKRLYDATITTDKTKPICPLCGTEIIIIGKKGFYDSECPECCIYSNGFTTEKDVIAFWNRRANGND